jgi:hypothetical protein
LAPEKSGRLTEVLIKLRFRKAIDGSNWPLLTGGRCSQVVVKSGLTVLYLGNIFHSEKISLTVLL